MEIYSKVVSIIFNLLLEGSFITVLLLICIRKFSKRLNTQASFTILKWILISYSIMVVFGWIIYFFPVIKTTDNSVIINNRITGSYAYAYLLMMLGQLFPFLFFFNRIGNKTYIILICTIFINNANQGLKIS